MFAQRALQGHKNAGQNKFLLSFALIFVIGLLISSIRLTHNDQEQETLSS